MSNQPAAAARRRSTLVLRVTGVAVLVATLTACFGDRGPGAGDFISDVGVVGLDATVTAESGRLESGSAEGPALTLEGEATVINGGSHLVRLTADREITGVVVAVEALDGAVWSLERAPDAGILPGHYLGRAGNAGDGGGTGADPGAAASRGPVPV